MTGCFAGPRPTRQSPSSSAQLPRNRSRLDLDPPPLAPPTCDPEPWPDGDRRSWTTPGYVDDTQEKATLSDSVKVEDKNMG